MVGVIGYFLIWRRLDKILVRGIKVKCRGGRLWLVNVIT